MAHDIENNRYVGVGKPAWHDLGITFQEQISAIEGQQIVHPEQIISLALNYIIPAGNETFNQPIDPNKWQAIVRSDNKLLSIQSASYVISQPRDIALAAQVYIDNRLATFETAGVLSEGTRFWMLLKLTGSTAEVIKDDVIESYLLFATSFDGTLAEIIKITIVRVVCANTMALAMNDNRSNLEFKIRHTKNMKDRVNEAHTIVAASLAAQAESLEAYRTMANKRITRTEQEDFVRAVIAPEQKEAEYTPQTTTKVNLVIDLLDTQRGIEMVPAARGTAWQAYNAVSEYTTHHIRTRTPANRLNNQWFDNNTIAMNKRALTIALAQ